MPAELLEQAISFMSEANPSVLSAIVKTAEAHARQIIENGGAAVFQETQEAVTGNVADIFKTLQAGMGPPTSTSDDDDL